MATENGAVEAADIEVIGLLAFTALAAMTRLSKDGDQAPTIEAHIEHARMSARAFELFTQLEAWCTNRDIDLPIWMLAHARQHGSNAQ